MFGAPIRDEDASMLYNLYQEIWAILIPMYENNKNKACFHYVQEILDDNKLNIKNEHYRKASILIKKLYDIEGKKSTTPTEATFQTS